MSYSKMGYYKVIASLVGIILLLILYIVIIPPKVEIKEIEVEKEVVVEIIKEPTYAYNITSAEREMLARLVYLEANTESLECQMAVISVVINRWQDGMWGDTLEEVVYYPYQFTPSSLIHKTTPTELNYTAVDLVLQNGCTLEPYVMYFRANHHFDWQGYKPYTQIDRVCFGYFDADR
jgi:spore germination cell wall hydrolase CwlJ-like protein